jgi:mono/diheme cytochrome c family protein
LRAFCIIFNLMAIEHRRAPWRACALLGFLVVGSVLAAGSNQGPPNPTPQTAEDLKAREVFLRVCVKCHPVERITAEGRSRAQWETTIITMQSARGAAVTPEEFDIVLDYLTRNHGRESIIVPGAAGRGAAGRGPRAHVGAADRHRVDDTAAERGKKTYASECVTCHGTSARGTDNGANLIRSTLVLRDRYGSAIGPFLKKGHPMQTGAPSAGLTAAQITDLSHFIWQRVNDTLQGSPAYDVKNVLTGDPKAGQAYFNGEGRCATCHSPAGDLAGYGRRYSPVEIQQRFVFPSAAGRGRGAGGAARKVVTVTVTAPGSAPVSGVLVSLDDFQVALRDAKGEYRSFTRTPAITVVKTDPYAAHVELLDRLTDKAMHDVVAYLETLK